MQKFIMDISRNEISEEISDNSSSAPYSAGDVWLRTMQGDVGKKFQAIITDNGEAFQIPEDALLSVWYSGSSGEGNYSAVGEKSAFTVAGNTVEIELIAQMLTVAGGGMLCLIMNRADGGQIGLWKMRYVTQSVPGFDSAAAEAYYSAYSEQVVQAVEAASRAETAAASITTDSTLSISGKAADAKAAGDAILAQKASVTAQLATKLTAYESSSYPGCYYRTADGVTEWLNPPMEAGVEYRTAERHLGAPVYVKLIDCGSLPASSGKWVTVGSTGVIFFCGTAVKEDGTIAQFPVISSSGTVLARANLSGSALYIVTFSDMSTYKAHFIMKYIKE